MNIIEKWLFRAKTGADIVSLGMVESVCIRYKDLYLNLLIAAEGDDKGDIRSLSWSTEPPQDIPIRDILAAKKGTE